MKPTAAPLETVVDILRATEEPATSEDIADALWLAARLPPGGRTLQPAPLPPAPAPQPPMPDSPRESVPPSRSETFGPTPYVESGTRRSGAAADLYPREAGEDAGAAGPAAVSIRSPGAAALPGTLGLGRSLRPLKRRIPSRTQVNLDEAATAHRIADTGDWTPVLRPAPERWLDMALVVEDSSSMLIWDRAVAELHRLFERQGAFRHVEIVHVGATADSQRVELYSRVGTRPDERRVRRPSELSGPLGRRIVAVVSDCVSPVWHNGVMATLLHDWDVPA